MTVQRWEQEPLPAPSRDVVDGWAHQVAAVAKLAGVIAATEFVPKGYRGSDAAVTAAILAGREMGIGPMTALQHLHVIDGRPAMSAQLMRALVLAHGHRLRVVESTSERCTLAGQRAGDPAESAVTWTMEDARRASITGKSNWSHYPRQMLMARATGELCRVLFPDVIGGMAYTVEEAEDIPAADNGAPPPATRTVRRRGATRSASSPADTSAAAIPADSPHPAPVAPSAAPGGDAPPLPDNDTPTPTTRPENRPQTPEQDQPGPTVPVSHNHPTVDLPAMDEGPRLPTDYTPGGDDRDDMTDPQRGHLFRLLGEAGRIEPRAVRIRTVSALAGRRLASMSQLTRAEATAVIDTLVRCAQSNDAHALDALVDEAWERITADELPAEWETHDDD